MAKGGPKKPGPGRPRKLADQNLREQVYRVLRVGGTRADAALISGIDISTILHESKADPEFDRELRRAESSGKILAAATVEKVINNQVDLRLSFEAAKWFLTHKFPREWGAKQGMLAADQLADVISTLQREIIEIIPKKYHPKLADRMNDLIKRIREMTQPSYP